jgi:hypothetical protein
MSSATSRRDTLAILLCVVTGIVGGLLLVIGFFLQINLLGHGPMTATNRFGAAMMFVGPGFASVGAIVGLLMTRSLPGRVLCGLQTVAGVVVVAYLTLMIGLGERAAQRGAAFQEKLRGETERIAALYATALERERAGERGLEILGHYEGRDGTILDAYLIGAAEEAGDSQLSLSQGSVVRFTWVGPIDARPPLKVEWTPPTPEMVETFKNQPGYEFLLEQPAPQEPQPVRRFLVLLEGAEAGSSVTSPMGEAPLPSVGPQPISITLSPEWSDQRTKTNEKLMP